MLLAGNKVMLCLVMAVGEIPLTTVLVKRLVKWLVARLVTHVLSWLLKSPLQLFTTHYNHLQPFTTMIKS